MPLAKTSIKLSIQLRMTLTSYLCLIGFYSEKEKTTETGRSTRTSTRAQAHTHTQVPMEVMNRELTNWTNLKRIILVW